MVNLPESLVIIKMINRGGNHFSALAVIPDDEGQSDMLLHHDGRRPSVVGALEFEGKTDVKGASDDVWASLDKDWTAFEVWVHAPTMKEWKQQLLTMVPAECEIEASFWNASVAGGR